MARSPSLKDAVADHLHDSEMVAFEGFTHLIPHVAAHEAIRQGRRDLTLIRMTPDLIYDQMIGMGMAKKLVFSYGGNAEGQHAARRADRGIIGVQQEAMLAAERVVVTVEEVVPDFHDVHPNAWDPSLRLHPHADRTNRRHA